MSERASLWSRFQAWRSRRRTQRLIDENRRLLAEHDRLLQERDRLMALGVFDDDLNLPRGLPDDPE